jgi:hypothetical protein
VTTARRQALRRTAVVLGGVFGLVFAAGFAVALGAAPDAAAAQPARGRLRPPAGVDCPPDHLTVYAGRVMHYQRDASRTEIGLRTDEGTTETVRIRHPDSTDPGAWFLLEQRPFERADWVRIEVAPGRLRAGLRAAAWVCDDGRNPVVDWTLPRQP